MNSENRNQIKNDADTNQMNEKALSSSQNGEDTCGCSEPKITAPAGVLQVPESQVESQTTTQGSSASSTNLLLPEANKDQSGQEEQGSEAKPIEVLGTEQRSSRKASGPQTAHGKARSKKNSLKHGLFFKPVLLPGESRAEYLGWLHGLHEYFQPRGTMECMEVEKLAEINWRDRRLPQIEKAEILETIFRLYIDPSSDWQAKVISEGLLANCNSPLVLLQAKQTLMLLRRMPFTEAFKEDSILIKQLYGEDRKRFLRRFLAYWHEAKVIETYGNKIGEREWIKIRVAFVDSEIERLKEQEKIIESIWYKPLIATVPSEERCNLLWRYETHFDRLKDRIVKRLERLQRMRKGNRRLPSSSSIFPDPGAEICYSVSAMAHSVLASK